MFEITTDPQRHLVRIKLSGMMSVEDVSELYRQEHAAIRAMGCPVGQHLLLIDSTQNGLQTQSVIDAFKGQISRPTRARRIAVVTGQSLSRMQARRLLTDQPGMIFATETEAEAWLFAEQIERAA
jgi:hypothetical protein